MLLKNKLAKEVASLVNALITNHVKEIYENLAELKNFKGKSEKRLDNLETYIPQKIIYSKAKKPAKKKGVRNKSK